jgi:hypothetical protein
MPGTETHGYDLVMEFSEQAYADLLGVFFDDTGLLVDAINALPGVELESSAFTVAILLDRPGDVSLPGDATDVIDIRIGLGEAGSVGSLRLVVGIDVDRSEADRDTVRINFREKIHFADLALGGVHVPIPSLEARLQDLFPALPVLPVPVERGTSNPKKIDNADFKVIDDTSGADLDATAALLTFGGGTAGDRNAFSQSFIPAGGRGGIAIFFEWLCRILAPAIEEALELPTGSFSGCSLNQTVRVDEEEDVDLTRLDLTLEDGFIQLRAEVTKSGFCYDATGKISAKLRIEIADGQLIVNSEVGDPDVDVDVPWYCWIAVAVIGAAIGGILGIVGAIVGGILGPLILWITTDAVEGTLDRIADEIAAAINEVAPNTEVPAFGINIIFDRVFLDDITIRCQIEFISHAPIRSEGILVVGNGQSIDLDSGKVGEGEMPTADLRWLGSGFGRKVTTGCNSYIARTGSTSFTSMSRYRLYPFYYESPATIPLTELGIYNPFPFFFGDSFIEFGWVYGVRTSENRFAVVQVIEVNYDHIKIRYRTYEKKLPAVQIVGGFKCERVFDISRDIAVQFEPSLLLREAGPALSISSTTSSVAKDRAVASVSDRSARMRRISDSLLNATASLLPKEQVIDKLISEIPLRDRRLGNWSTLVKPLMRDVGRFDALASNFKPPLEYSWAIDGTKLAASGTITVKGVSMSYSITASRLVLKPKEKKTVEFELKATVSDAEDTFLSTIQCIKFVPSCDRNIRVIPDWKIFHATYMENFGIAEVAEAGAASAIR